MKKFPHLRNSWRSSLITNWIRSFQVTVLVSWTRSLSGWRVYLPPGSDQDVIPYFLKGRLKIVHSLENGSDTILEIQEKPGLLGEIELLLDRVCITSVITDQDSLVVQLCSAFQGPPPAGSHLFALYGQDLG